MANVRYGIYVEDENGSMSLVRELTFDENGVADVRGAVASGQKWALGILYDDKTPRFHLSERYDVLPETFRGPPASD